MSHSILLSICFFKFKASLFHNTVTNFFIPELVTGIKSLSWLLTEGLYLLFNHEVKDLKDMT